VRNISFPLLAAARSEANVHIIETIIYGMSLSICSAIIIFSEAYVMASSILPCRRFVASKDATAWDLLHSALMGLALHWISQINHFLVWFAHTRTNYSSRICPHIFLRATQRGVCRRPVYVCVRVCFRVSHGGILSKRLNILWNLFNRLVAALFWFYYTEGLEEISRGFCATGC